MRSVRFGVSGVESNTPKEIMDGMKKYQISSTRKHYSSLSLLRFI